MNIKTITLILVIAAAIALAFLIPGKEPVKHQAASGLQAPDFELKDISGKTWKLSDLKGKIVLVNFWATWCDSCKEENPSLHKFIQSEKENKNLVILTILVNDSAQNAAEYLKKNNFDFTVLIDDKKTSAEYGITGVPETYIISKDGTLKKKIIGPAPWDAPEMKAAIEKFISET